VDYEVLDILEKMSVRELKIVKLRKRGFKRYEIAEKLGISERQLHRIMSNGNFRDLHQLLDQYGYFEKKKPASKRVRKKVLSLGGTPADWERFENWLAFRKTGQTPRRWNDDS